MKTPEEIKEEIYLILDKNLSTDEKSGCPEVVILGKSVDLLYNLMREYALSLLPSDEEINKANKEIFKNFFGKKDFETWDLAFNHCAKWFKRKILTKIELLI